MKGYFRALLSIVYPFKCQICGVKQSENDVSLCSDCCHKIKKNEPPFCTKCGKSLPQALPPASLQASQTSVCLCGDCQKGNFHFQRAWNAALYEGVLKECVHLIKFKRKMSLIKPLSKILIDFGKSFLDMGKFDFLIPVPLDRKKKRQREFNQASLLMESMAKEFKIASSCNNLVKIRPTPPQSSLKREQRFTNVKGVFRVRRPDKINNKTVLLIDDVFTTGATSSECAKALKNNGAKHIEVLTLARGR